VSREEQVLEELRALLREAVTERRGLVTFTRLGGAELDRLARQAERHALEQVASRIPRDPNGPILAAVAAALQVMHQELDHLEAATNIRPDSRALARDDVIWRTFERVAQLLGVL